MIVDTVCNLLKKNQATERVIEEKIRELEIMEPQNYVQITQNNVLSSTTPTIKPKNVKIVKIGAIAAKPKNHKNVQISCLRTLSPGSAESV